MLEVVEKLEHACDTDTRPNHESCDLFTYDSTDRTIYFGWILPCVLSYSRELEKKAIAAVETMDTERPRPLLDYAKMPAVGDPKAEVFHGCKSLDHCHNSLQVTFCYGISRQTSAQNRFLHSNKR